MANLRIAIPSTGALYEDSINFLEKKNLKINRLNSRKYTADIPSLSNVRVLFQRQSDITMELDNDSADIGIVGLSWPDEPPGNKLYRDTTNVNTYVF